jgi:plasmid stability protein
MNQLTVRGFDDELIAKLRGLAEQEGTSLNQAALKLLRRGAGLADAEENINTIGSSLDDLFGTWSKEEAESFNDALQVFETVDESAWR